MDKYIWDIGEIDKGSIKLKNIPLSWMYYIDNSNYKTLSMETKTIEKKEKREFTINWFDNPVKHGIVKYKNYTVIIDESVDKYLLSLTHTYRNYYNCGNITKELIINKSDDLLKSIESICPDIYTIYDDVEKWFGKRFAKFYWSYDFKCSRSKEFNVKSEVTKPIKEFYYAVDYYFNVGRSWATDIHGKFFQRICENYTNEIKVKQKITEYLNQIGFENE